MTLKDIKQFQEIFDKKFKVDSVKSSIFLTEFSLFLVSSFAR